MTTSSRFPAAVWLTCALAVGPFTGCTGDPSPLASSPLGASTEGAEVAGGAATGAVLPLEVLGPQGTSVAATFRLQGVKNIARIAIECHACGYDDRTLDGNAALTKGSLRINGRKPIALKRYTGGPSPVGNPDLVLPATAEAYGGIGGGFRTIRFTVPSEGLVEGTNTLVFEHTHPSTESLGYRIVDLAFLGADGAAVDLPDGSLRRDDPATWQAPRPDEIAQGLALWHQPGILNDPGFDALNGAAAGGAIQAACADCHADDGRDLKYFNYSNRSIVERAKFHGLTGAQGERIASYIRSLPLPIAPAARPWNPPYQPGPNLDQRPAYEWASGAGIESVLADDADVRAYLFPQGTSAKAVQAVVDRFSTLNLRELPLALQLPDWNKWLPRVHPRDAFDVLDPVVRNDEKGTPVGQPFFDVVYAAAAAAPTKETITALRARLEQWLGRGATCYTQSLTGGPAYRAANADVMAAVALPPRLPLIQSEAECKQDRHNATRMTPIEIAKQGLAAWISIKQWELVHTAALEEAAKNLPATCIGETCVAAGERGWFLDGFSVFFRAPHYIGYNADQFTTQDLLVGTYESSAWYQLQLVLNPGYRRNVPPAGQPDNADPPMPSHFPYTIVFMEKLAQESQHPDPFRFWATYIKIRQQQTNGHYGVENGLDLRTAQPFYLYSDESGGTALRDVGQPLWRHIAGAALADFVADAQLAKPQQWAQANQNSDVQGPNIPGADFVAYDFANPTPGDLPFQVPGPRQGTNTFRVVPQLRQVVQVDPAIVQRLINWAQVMWPGREQVGVPAWNDLSTL